MFGLFESINNVANVGVGLVQGELPTQRQVVKLISDGVSVAAIAQITGYSVEVINSIIEGV